MKMIALGARLSIIILFTCTSLGLHAAEPRLTVAGRLTPTASTWTPQQYGWGDGLGVKPYAPSNQPWFWTPC